jgi:hypothetical protein
MAVVMEEGQLRALGDRCDQQVYRGRPAMLTPEGEGCLGLESTSAVGCIEGDERQLSELGATFRVVARASGGIQELQRDEIAKRDLVELDERRPSCRDASRGFASVPRAGVGEIPRHLRFAEPTKFFRRRAESPFAFDSPEETPSRVQANDLVEGPIDRLRERPGAEDLLRLCRLLAVDDHRGLVGFGYLFCHG